jgi:hypothetical protein
MFGQQSRGHLAKAYMREMWACCMRFSQAAVATANAGCAKRLPYVAKLAESMKLLLPHSKDEMASPSFDGVLEQLNQRFGSCLKLGPLKSPCLAPVLPENHIRAY